METKPDKAVSIIECDMNVSPPATVIPTVRNTTMVNVCQLELQLCLSDIRDLNVCPAFQVDFDAPLGYKEPERRPQHHEEPTVGALLQLTGRGHRARGGCKWRGHRARGGAMG